jgi:phosphatidylserine decarboxylase
MSKREKIIIGVMLFSILFALVYFLTPSLTGREEKTGDQYSGSEKIIQEIGAELKKVAASPNENYIITRAEAAWAKDPFYRKIQPAPVKAAAGSQEIVYSGFVDMGEKKLAVVNGSTYQVGDKLDFGGSFYLKSVEPSRVVIVDKQNQRNIVIKLKDESF